MSPILLFSRQSHWLSQIRTVWSTVETGFDVQATTQCSTHVHVSPATGPWTLGQVQHVAMAAVYFERCIDAMVPETRRLNDWCKSNRWNDRFKTLSMAQIFHDIQAQPTAKKVAEHMCWCSKGSETGVTAGARTDFQHYTFRWNLASLSSIKGTVEFRLPPPSANAGQAIGWIIFTVSLVHWATQHAGELDPSKPGQLDDLRRSVTQGAELSGMQDLAPVLCLFDGVQPLPEGPMPDLEDLSA